MGWHLGTILQKRAWPNLAVGWRGKSKSLGIVQKVNNMQKPVFLVLTNFCNLVEKKRLENVQTSVGLVYSLILGINLDINKSMLIPYQSYFTFWWHYGSYPINLVWKSRNISAYTSFNWSGCYTNYYKYSYTWVSQAYIPDINSDYKWHT